MSEDCVGIEIRAHVATVEIRRPPHNFFDYVLIQRLADAFEALDRDDSCRALVLCSDGKSFCAGANFGDGRKLDADGNVPGAPNRGEAGHLYMEAVRLFRTRKPIVAAVQGAAIGGGLGLAMVADVRVAAAEARFAANFTRLGFHPGFGLSVTLPAVIGATRAAEMFYTGRRVKGDEAVAMGLADRLAPLDAVRAAAWALAREIAVSAPLAVMATRATLRNGLADRVEVATAHELEVQTVLRKSEDFREGVAASAERREPRFSGR